MFSSACSCLTPTINTWQCNNYLDMCIHTKYALSTEIRQIRHGDILDDYSVHAGEGVKEERKTMKAEEEDEKSSPRWRTVEDGPARGAESYSRSYPLIRDMRGRDIANSFWIYNETTTSQNTKKRYDTH